MKIDIRKIMLKRESLYSPYATLDKDAIKLEPLEPDLRPVFSRDVDRIIHCKSYTRYMDKTQVFTGGKNDHISTRMVHVQLVSKIARTIGRALSLNEDLIEAIALGHDLGHTPYGHEGEKLLDKLSKKYHEGPFMHNVQSVRNLMTIEKKNISVQVLDGILCHNGEFVIDEYYPKKKSVQDFLNDYHECYKNQDYGKKLVPMTLEGCVVRISDTVGYLGRDIEDAISLAILGINELPEEITKIVGRSNKSIINNIVLDIIENSLDKPYMKLSKGMYEAVLKLKKFNYQNIYGKCHTKTELDSYALMFNCLFERLLDALNTEDKTQNIYLNFLNQMDDTYNKDNSNVRKVIDYIAGMTDEYFVKEYKATRV